MTGDLIPQPGPAISAMVLAGGKSSRFGKDKAFLSVGGQPLVARTVHQLAALSDDLILITNDPLPYEPLRLPVRLVPDERPGEGSLMGLYSGLKAARYPHALAVACDMPFLNLSLLRYMLSLVTGYDVVIPRVSGCLEPLHAIYSKGCLPFMTRLLEQGQRRIIAFFSEVRVRCVEEEEIDRFDPQRLSLLNVNTPADWDRAQKFLENDR